MLKFLYILFYLAQQVKLAEKIGIVSRNIENNIKKLKEYGILIGHGSPKNGYWEIIDKDLQE